MSSALGEAKPGSIVHLEKIRDASTAPAVSDSPRDQQPSFLNGCDIGLSALVAGITGISVPSRSYNILCAGKPILAVGEPQGEVS